MEKRCSSSNRPGITELPTGTLIWAPAMLSRNSGRFRLQIFALLVASTKRLTRASEGMPLQAIFLLLRNMAYIFTDRTLVGKSLFLVHTSQMASHGSTTFQTMGIKLAVSSVNVSGMTLLPWWFVHVYTFICTVNFGYNDVPPGKNKKVSICEVSLYPKYTHFGIMYTCMYGCRILCLFTCVIWRNIPPCTCTSFYQRTCDCTVCRRTTLACFSQTHPLSHAFSARVGWCAVRFSSMAMLKLSNWSVCRYIRSN